MLDAISGLLTAEAAPWWASGLSAIAGVIVGGIPAYFTARASDRRAFNLDLQRSNIRAVEEACSDFLLACESATTFAYSIPQFSLFTEEELKKSPLLTAEQEKVRREKFERIKSAFFRVALIAPPNVQEYAQNYFWTMHEMLSSATDQKLNRSIWSTEDIDIKRGAFLVMVRSACGIDQLPVYKKQTRRNRKLERRSAKYRRKEEARKQKAG